MTYHAQRRQTLTLLSIALVLSMSTWFSASAVIPQLRALWNLNPSTSAWLTIAVQIGFAVGAVISSLFNLADIIAAKHIILIGSIGAALANLLLEWAGGPELGIPLRFATGFFVAGIYPPAFKLISTWYREGRGLALGILAAAISVGNGLPHLVNGLGGLDWRVVILVTSSLTIVGGLIVEFAVTHGPFPFPAAIFDPKQIRLAFANRGVRLATMGYVGHMWELFAVYAWFSVFFADSLRSKGLMVGANASFATYAVFLAGAFGCWAGGVLADHNGRTWTTTLMLAVSGSCSLLIGLFFDTSPWLLLAIGLIWGFTIVADSAQFSTMVTELADQAYVGTALTLQLATGFAITVPTIWLIPILEPFLTWKWVFILLVPGPLMGILAMRRLRSLPEAKQISGGKA